jgi:hypothetical protein
VRRESEMVWESEFKLQRDLAEYLRQCGFMTFTEIVIPGCEQGRVDVAAVKPGMYAQKDIRAYEVKITKQVFDKDINENKWRKYLNVFHRVYFAAPEGVLKKSDIPEGAGLILRNNNGWHVVKAAKFNNPEKLDVDSILALLYHGYEESRIMRRLRDKIIADENVTLYQQAKKIGWEIARRLNNSKETQIEEWCLQLWGLFKRFGFDVPGRIISEGIKGVDENPIVHLPSLYEIENLLNGADALMKDIATLKAIGEYLCSIDYPEEVEGRRTWRSRKPVREKAIELMNS